MASLAHYSPEDVTVIIAGVTQIVGFVDGTFVTITKDTQGFTTRESSDGVVSRTYKKSGLHTVKLSLASTSDSNQVLTHCFHADAITRIAKFTLIIKDQLGETLFFSPTCWVETLPDVDYDLDITARTWSIKCADAGSNIGGNESTESSSNFLNTILSLVPQIL